MSFVTNKSLKVALEVYKSESEKRLPKKVSQLENDVPYLTEGVVTEKLEDYYNKTQIDELINTGFVVTDDTLILDNKADHFVIVDETLNII